LPALDHGVHGTGRGRGCKEGLSTDAVHGTSSWSQPGRSDAAPRTVNVGAGGRLLNTGIQPKGVRLAVLSAPPRPAEYGHMGATVFVVDDHAGFRRSARLMLEIEGYVVVGEAADGAAALTGVRQLEPDIALVDVHLPDVDGFELAARIAALVR